MKLNSLIPIFLAATGVTLVANVMPATAMSFQLSPTYVDTGNNNSILQPGQLSINVEEFSTNRVKFTIANNNIGNNTVNPSRIFEVMFGKDKNFSSLLSWSGLIDKDDNVILGGNSGVDFNKDTKKNPKDPPGKFQWDSAFTALRDGSAHWGVDVGESLGVLFTLNQNVTFSQIEQGFNSGNLAIALHVGSLPNGGSDWYGTRGVTSEDIPEPLTMLGTTMAFGFAGLCKGEYDKKKKKQKVTT